KPMILDGHVPALDVACLIEGAAKRGRGTCHAIGRAAVDKGDDWHRLLLRTRSERPGRCATEHSDELAASHCPMPPVLPTERIAHLGTADCCIHPPGNDMIASTPPKIFSKEVAQKQA